jgi:hypothetical protein
MPLGQVILGVRNLDVAAQRFEAAGLTVLDGGLHPGVGTANRVIPLGNAYLELLGVVDGAVAATTDYGRALLDRTRDGDRLVRWSIRTDDIDAAAARLDLTVERRQRQRPDGSRLTWRAAGIAVALREPCLPFFMQWDDGSQYPGATPVVHRAGASALAWIRISTDDRAKLARWTEGARELPLRIDAGAPALVETAIATSGGIVVVQANGMVAPAVE